MAEAFGSGNMETTTNNISWKKNILIALGAIALVGLCIVGVYYYTVTVPKNKIAKHNNAYYASLLQNNPTVLQNSFADDVKNGLNDKYTKSDAYFVTHRFFDNNGNIYEIYDYVNSHPELAFLKEAEGIYPGIFEQIKNKTLPATFVDRAVYAYLAYVEVLEKHGYTDIAAIGTAANQYAKTAYFAKTVSTEMTNKARVPSRVKYVERDSNKAREFLNLAKGDVADILDGKITLDDVPARDILVGLNQYAAALRYLDGLGVDISFSPKTSKEIFTFTMDYSYRFVPELNLFTSLLNASTLTVLNATSPYEVKDALYPILDLDTKKGKLLDASIIHKIIDSRFEKKPRLISDTNMDIYSKRNALTLAKKVPEFKAWLISNGWTDADFQ